MAEPCKQESHLGELQATMQAISRSQIEMQNDQRRLFKLIEEIARQSEQIKSLVQRVDKSEKDIEGLFSRMRLAELSPGQQASTLQTYGVMVIISAIVAFIMKKFGG